MEIISNDSGLSRVAVATKRFFVATVAVTPSPLALAGSSGRSDYDQQKVFCRSWNIVELQGK
jgi:hypothetical protein